MISQELKEELNSLRERGFQCEATEEGSRIFIFFKDFLLPENVYNVDKTDLLIYTSNLYPNCGFDMFWVDEKLTLKDGAIPRNGDSIEPYLGKKWRRFSYHPYNAKSWNPSEDNLGSYVEYIQQRLRRGD